MSDYKWAKRSFQTNRKRFYLERFWQLQASGQLRTRKAQQFFVLSWTEAQTQSSILRIDRVENIQRKKLYMEIFTEKVKENPVNSFTEWEKCQIQLTTWVGLSWSFSTWSRLPSLVRAVQPSINVKSSNLVQIKMYLTAY